VKFLGGEPFLAAETLRVMEMLVDANPEARCHVTTNGTQWTPRVERILDMLPVDVAVSVDGATAETYESIRQGSSWDTVQRNLDRFQEIAARKGTDVTITFCLMTANWHEFAAFCRMADARGIGCAVNTVSQPEHLTLYQMSVPALQEVLDGLEATEEAEGDSFSLSRATWEGVLDKLRTHLDDR
jgi:MoaA/NifB/PqqE/SkfB family radical SAM enzyme